MPSSGVAADHAADVRGPHRRVLRHPPLVRQTPVRQIFGADHRARRFRLGRIEASHEAGKVEVLKVMSWFVAGVMYTLMH